MFDINEFYTFSSLHVATVRPHIKIRWFAITRACFFSTSVWSENISLSFLDGKDSINTYSPFRRCRVHAGFDLAGRDS